MGKSCDVHVPPQQSKKMNIYTRCLNKLKLLKAFWKGTNKHWLKDENSFTCNPSSNKEKFPGIMKKVAVFCRTHLVNQMATILLSRTQNVDVQLFNLNNDLDHPLVGLRLHNCTGPGPRMTLLMTHTSAVTIMRENFGTPLTFNKPHMCIDQDRWYGGYLISWL